MVRLALLDYYQRKHNMPRVTRSNSNVAVPVEQAQLISPGAFRFSTAEAEALGGAGITLEQIGKQKKREKEALQELAKRKRAATDSLSASKALKARQLADLELEAANQLPEEDARQKARDVVIEKYNNFRLSLDMSPEQRQNEDIESGAWNGKVARESSIFDVASEVKTDITVGSATLIDVIGNDDGSSDNALKIQNQIDSVRAALQREMTKEEAEIRLTEFVRQGEELRAEVAVENIKPNLIAAIEAGDKQDGLVVLRASVNQLIKDGVLTKVEGAQTDKVLGDWIDNFVAGREKRAKDAVKLTTTEAYADLSGKIVGGTLTFQDIDESSLLKADKEKWRTYIKGSYKDAPKENTSAGLLDATIAVFDAATLQLSPTEAADILLEARFIDHSITNDQFNWGLDKIKNPYPRQILEDLRATYNSNNEDFNRIFKADKDRNKNVNEALIAWVDDLIKRDKVPAFDFKKKMHAVSSQFRVGNARWYDIGQIIERGGRNWEVVGFDENGEPLVDEVQ